MWRGYGVFPAAVAVMLALTASAVHAQDASDYEQASRSRRLALFDLPRLEDVATAGDQAVRVYVDTAFRGLLPALILERSRRGMPRLRVISSQRVGLKGGRLVMNVAVPLADWDRLFDAGVRADADWRAFEAQRSKAPVDRPAPGAETALSEIVVCADGQDSIVEIATGGQVTRAAEHDCEFTELGQYARVLAKEAVRLIPGCATFRPLGGYGDFDGLAMCALMTGNRRAALGAANRAFGPHRRDLDKLAGPNIIADWPGRPEAVGRASFVQMWSEITKSVSPTFQILEGAGQGRHKVTLRGSIFFANPDDDGYQRADCIETWTFSAGRWSLSRLRVGKFRAEGLTRDPRNPT